MRNTPLLPRPWLVPLGGVGADHSMCNWQSPNVCFVLMSESFTVATPSFTTHLSPFSQAERSLPSNRMIASDGGSASVLPGLMIGGSCHFMPFRYSPWARQLGAATAAAHTNANIGARHF